jgi:hypothetical protein
MPISPMVSRMRFVTSMDGSVRSYAPIMIMASSRSSPPPLPTWPWFPQTRSGCCCPSTASRRPASNHVSSGNGLFVGRQAGHRRRWRCPALGEGQVRRRKKWTMYNSDARSPRSVSADDAPIALSALMQLRSTPHHHRVDCCCCQPLRELFVTVLRKSEILRWLVLLDQLQSRRHYSG